LHRKSRVQAEATYVFDDGETMDYRQGIRSRLQVRAVVRRGTLEIETQLTEKGYGTCEPMVMTYDAFDKVLLNGMPLDAFLSDRLAAGSERP
jgi:hypothetical protein